MNGLDGNVEVIGVRTHSPHLVAVELSLCVPTQDRVSDVWIGLADQACERGSVEGRELNGHEQTAIGRHAGEQRLPEGVVAVQAIGAAEQEWSCQVDSRVGRLG
jgi:hypothetical protein